MFVLYWSLERIGILFESEDIVYKILIDNNEYKFKCVGNLGLFIDNFRCFLYYQIYIISH